MLCDGAAGAGVGKHRSFSFLHCRLQRHSRRSLPGRRRSSSCCLSGCSIRFGADLCSDLRLAKGSRAGCRGADISSSATTYRRIPSTQRARRRASPPDSAARRLGSRLAAPARTGIAARRRGRREGRWQRRRGCGPALELLLDKIPRNFDASLRLTVRAFQGSELLDRQHVFAFFPAVVFLVYSTEAVLKLRKLRPGFGDVCGFVRRRRSQDARRQFLEFRRPCFGALGVAVKSLQLRVQKVFGLASFAGSQAVATKA
mmetsp:Transcript_39062/g.107631  ORF Transcript_39062/g.107631 Transcript_39062/m.107631 type:complete len:258 (+) Transcript_39062:554-1327(+)